MRSGETKGLHTLALFLQDSLHRRVVAKPAEAVGNQVATAALGALDDDDTRRIRLLAEAAHCAVICGTHRGTLWHVIGRNLSV
jgi:hypothetical protein